MSLATKLVTLRKQNGLTQMDLAERLNVSRQAVSKWEVGAAIPSTDNLKVLGELYGVQIDYLLSDEVDSNYKSLEIPDNNPVGQYDTHKRQQYKWFAVWGMAIVLAITALIFVAMAHSQEQNQVIPMEDMYTVTEDDYSGGTFMIE